MSNMQSKVDNPADIDSFSWFVKTLDEEQQKQNVSGEHLADELDESQTINLLRFIKVSDPSVSSLMEFCKSELGMSVLTTTNVLDKLEKRGDITIVEVSRASEIPSRPVLVEKIVKITAKGLKKL